jgi:superfamily I DNA and/or RNA helicase
VLVHKEPKVISPSSCIVYLRGNPLNNVERILDFKAYIKIFYANGRKTAYKKTDVCLVSNVLENEKVKHTLEYLKALAGSIGSEENDFLDKQYQKMDSLSDESVLAKYLSGDVPEKRTCENVKIFPFGLNLSQERAVEKALCHQVSIIEGPPGTGKTQTILNIIANLIADNKTVAVVSNNNAAIQNVYDKLDAYKLSYFAAMLGKKENIEAFFAKQEQKVYPQPEENILKDTQSVYSILEQNIVEIKQLLQTYNEAAQASQELEALKVEKRHFMKRYENQPEALDEYEEIFLKKDTKTLLSFLAELESLQSQHKEITFLFKIKALFKYKVFAFSLYDHPLNGLILLLQKVFYALREKELLETLEEGKNTLQHRDFETLMEAYKDDSMKLFALHLSKKYRLGEQREQFEPDILWKDFDAFTKEYPVILSTTHALRNCTKENFLYDYLIIDEASQVDIVAGGLALSCARNVVIVGDQKQLPHIVGQEIEDRIDHTFAQYPVDHAYHYTNSLLASALMVFEEAPRTLLREHYRCHPKIIDFCNKKFYNNELVILSKDDHNSSPLALINTAEGNHARGKYNQRQIDVIKNEVLPLVKTEDMGIVSPFREQANKLSHTIVEIDGLEIDTVHKYQGREKDVIIITTVVDKENEFADDPNLLNVAISRAKKQLYVIVSDREKNPNMKDLVQYIRYNNFEIAESRTYSIFDLLYESYAPYLKRYLSKANEKKLSQFQSENLMAVLIEEVLELEAYRHLNYVFNYILSNLLKDTSILSEDERAFVNADSHIDFLIYSKIHKRAVLAVEVDGVTFHANNPEQLKRDALKDRILEKYHIPIIRFGTDGSEERKKLIEKLEEVG